MRSTWPAETVLAVLAAASVEAAALSLAYLAISWLSGHGAPIVGLPAFAITVGLGLALGRGLRRASWRRYLLVVPAAAVVTGVVGGWVAATAAGTPADPVSVVASGGSWLLGIGVLRGTAHAELDDEAYVVERLLRVGMLGLPAFWIVAAANGLPANPTYTADAFGATLTFVSSALLGLGLGRLRELRVETVDRAAHRRWLVLLLGVTGLVLVAGVPLAALLQVPLATAVAGAGGPLAVVLVDVFVALAAPLLVILSAFADAIGPVDFHLNLPTISFGPGSGNPLSGDMTSIALVLFGVLVSVELLAVLVLAAMLLRARRKRRSTGGPESREAEPVQLRLVVRLPRLRRRRGFMGTPATAAEAYRFALRLLADHEEGRRPGETPREHATRVRGTAIGSSVAHLAADYQLAELGGRRLSDAEEQRARRRWHEISRLTR